MQTFGEEHKDFFFGRTRPRDEIYELLKNNLLTVIFGKSGIGKSSLLNAGLIPILRENFFLPILIRIPFADRQIDPLKFTRRCIEAEIRKYIAKDFNYPEHTTLWQFFREANYTGGAVIPVLIFDQFEEYFSFGKENPAGTKAFIRELSDLIENRVPEALPDEARKIISTADNRNIFHVVISLREDFLAALEDLSREIPSLNKVRYRIQQLHGQEAFEAVYFPDKQLLDEATAIHLLKKIIPQKTIAANDVVTGESLKDDWQERDFEPYILSLFCYQVNEKRIAAGQAIISNELIDLTKVETILQDYYDSCLRKYRRKYYRNFGPILEKNLISDEGYRLPKPATEFKTLSEQAINDLVDDRIIHRESRNEISYIEISHDLLAKVVYDRKIAEKDRKRSYLSIGALMVITLLIFFAVYFTREHQNFQKLQTYVDSLKQQDSVLVKSANTIESLNTTVADLVTGDTSASGSGVADPVIKSSGTIYFQVNNKKSAQQINLCTDALKKLNFKIPGVEVVSNKPFKNAVKYFHKEDESTAALIKSICDRYYSQPFVITSMIGTPYEKKTPIGRTEVWVNYEPYFLQLYSPTPAVRTSAAEFMVKNYKTADTLRQWPIKMIETAHNNPGNQNGIYNTLVVFDAMELSYLRESEPAILSWLNEVEKYSEPGSKTSQLIQLVRIKMSGRQKL